MNGLQRSDPLIRAQPQTNRFTHAPALHANPLLSVLQVLSWLLWHPLAWRNLVARTDEQLAPDFALLQLSRRQWRDGVWRWLLWRALTGCALVAAAVVGVTGWGIGLSPLKLIMSLTFAVTTSLSVGLMIAVCVSLAGGIATSLAVGLAAGLAITFTRYELDWVRNGMPNLNLDNIVQGGWMFALACAVPAGVCGYVVRMVAENRRSAVAPSLAQRAGSLAVGIPIALLGVAISSGLASDIARNRALITWPVVLLGMLAYGLFLGSAVYMRTGRLWDGVRWGMALSFGVGVTLCVTYFLAYGLAARAPLLSFICFGMAYCIAACLLFSALFTLPHAAASRIAGVQVGAIVGALMIGCGGVGYYVYAVGQYETAWTNFIPVLLLAATITLLGLLTNWWLPALLYPLLALWNRLLFRLDEQQSGGVLYCHRHSAFWDEQQRLPLLGLDEHLVLLIERQPQAGAAALDYLRSSRQAWAARAAQIELDARQLQRCQSVSAISAIHRTLAVGELAGPASALLRTFSRLSSDIDVALSQVNAYHQRLGLNAAAERLNGLLRELTRSSEPYAARFYPVAEGWQRLVADHVQSLMQSAERNQEIANPYVVGVPLTQQQEIFVGRTDVIARIEELLAAPDYPPLLLYGQRRMGKTSLLHNLKWLLPFEIIALFVDLQGPVSNASNHAGFLYNLAKLMRKSAEEQGVTLPDLTLASLQSDPFTLFDDWLDAVERTLVAQGRRTILLTLDEFEALDKALRRKDALDEEAVLGMVRHLVQYRTRFKVMMAGSHRLQEFQRWAGYLINAQTIHLGYLQEAEACRLIEQPVRDFPLRYEPAARQAVLALTHGHPYLVQLLCAEIVNLKNEQAPALRRLARRADVEAAIAATLSTGDQFFTDIYLNQTDDDGRRLLTLLAGQSAHRPLPRAALQPHFPDPATLDATLTKLTERELIHQGQNHYSFQVELIRRWFVGQATTHHIHPS